MRLPKFMFKQVISVTLFIFVSWTIAGAYTIVFHGGKRVEIPDNFTVTSTSIIYEAAPGLNVSFQLKSIDVPATERANNVASGSLLRRIGIERVQTPATATTTQAATRTITNRDLEPFERARVTGEMIWEKRRKELGQPSREEMRREAERSEAALDEFLAKKRLEEANYLREREAEMRARIAAQTNSANFQGGQYYNGLAPVDYGGFGAFDSRFRFGQGFPSRFNTGSPCGFNASASCLMTHPSSLFNQGDFHGRRTTFTAPRTNVGGFRGGVFVSPGRRR